MTTRDQARRTTGERQLAEGVRATPEPPVGPSLPDRLLAARERKGVDLYRAERDTKIRARYLAALERGDFKELPGTVYTKGFLRNYALYLGLDPDDVLLQWRRERGDAQPAEPVIVAPKPLTTPRQGFVFSSGVFVAALLTVIVVAFVGYLAFQLLRWGQLPTLTITSPSTLVSDVADTTTSYTLRGTATGGASIAISAPGQDVIRVNADSSGAWTSVVPLRHGRNQFDITATDPTTGQTTATQTVYITVPFSIVLSPTLTVDSPTDGSSFQNGAIPVSGTTTGATKVTVSAAYAGSVGTAASSPAPGSTPLPTPAAPTPVTVSPASDGTFSTPFELTAGRWTLTITASSDQGRTTQLTRSITVNFKGVNVVVTIKGGPAWIKAWEDGNVDPNLGAAGHVYQAGQTVTFTGQTSVEVRTGSSGTTFFTVNGTNVGALGPPGIPQTWLFAPPAPPSQTQHT